MGGAQVGCGLGLGTHHSVIGRQCTSVYLPLCLWLARDMKTSILTL